MFIYFVKFELKGSFQIQYSACLDGPHLLTQVRMEPGNIVQKVYSVLKSCRSNMNLDMGNKATL